MIMVVDQNGDLLSAGAGQPSRGKTRAHTRASSVPQVLFGSPSTLGVAARIRPDDADIGRGKMPLQRKWRGEPIDRCQMMTLYRSKTGTVDAFRYQPGWSNSRLLHVRFR